LGLGLQHWLEQHPDQIVLVLVNELDSRRAMLQLNSQMDAATSTRVLVTPIRERDYGRDDWWHSRKGWKAVMYSLISMSFATTVSADEDSQPSVGPDEYENLFFGQLHNAEMP